MINLAVIELKDILKYLIKITLLIVVVVGLTKYFSSFKTQLNVTKSSFLACLDTAIPSMKSVNKKEDTNVKKVEPLKMPLGIELGMIDTIKESATVQESKEEKNISNEENTEEIIEAQTGVKTEVLNSKVPEKYTSEYNGVKIRNETDIKLTKEMLKPDVKLNTESLIIYHTHTCESYTQTKAYTYKASGNFRTKDTNCNMVRVGAELKKYMEHYGYKVEQETTLFDFPSYNESYDRSLKAIDKLLDKNEGTDILFDIHRDAIADSTYAPTVKIGDEEAAQLMFVIGSNGGGSEHDNWNKNLKFAIKIQEKANEMYPGLFKPIILRNSRYNQQLAIGSSIIEVGATGNTMEQCLVSMRYLSKILSEVLATK